MSSIRVAATLALATATLVTPLLAGCQKDTSVPVSYTHLTLPTIYSV